MTRRLQRYLPAPGPSLCLMHGVIEIERKSYSLNNRTENMYLGWAGPEYQATQLEQLLKSYGGDAKLSELVCSCLITSFDIQRGKPHFFTNVPKGSIECVEFIFRILSRFCVVVSRWKGNRLLRSRCNARNICCTGKQRDKEAREEKEKKRG